MADFIERQGWDGAALESAQTIRASASVLAGLGTASSPRATASPPRERYEDQGRLGAGGMGEVRLCRDRWLGRNIAVKTTRADRELSAETRARFVREARVQGQLEHPSIVPVYDLGVDDAGQEFFTMKRITGRTLRDVLASSSSEHGSARGAAPFSLPKLLGILRQVCLAVDYAHSKGVVHRDLKPDNVMIGDFGEVYVVDWGLAKVVGTEGESVEDQEAFAGRTTQGQILGTPGYMPPEQIGNADKADTRSDVYALGAILFEVLALEPMHAGTSVEEILRSTQIGEAIPPSVRAPARDIPPELDALCLRATAFASKDRMPCARDLAEGIEGFLDGDRDLEARREASRRHADAAEEAKARMRAGGSDAGEARRIALREAGRAVVLDPEGRQGMRTALDVMLEAPREMPEAVRQEVEKTEIAHRRVRGVVALLAYLSFFLFVESLPLWVHVRSTTGLHLVGALMFAAFLIEALPLLSQRVQWTSSLLACGAALAFAGIALTSGFAGSLILVPGLAIGLTAAGVSNEPTAKYRRLYFAFGTLAFLAPFCAEWAGLVPLMYEFSGDQLRIHALFIGFSEAPVRIAMLFAMLAGFVTAMTAIIRVTDRELSLRQNWLLQIWHLRAMAGTE